MSPFNTYPVSEKNREDKPDLSEITSTKISTNTKNYSDVNSDGFSSSFGVDLLGKRGDSILNERWDKIILISARILKITPTSVSCDCIISLENQIVETRAFPKLLFENINPMKEESVVKIKISSKAGSTRTDIIDGKGLGIEKEFEIFDLWEELETFENKPAF